MEPVTANKCARPALSWPSGCRPSGRQPSQERLDEELDRAMREGPSSAATAAASVAPAGPGGQATRWGRGWVLAGVWPGAKASDTNAGRLCSVLLVAIVSMLCHAVLHCTRSALQVAAGGGGGGSAASAHRRHPGRCGGCACGGRLWPAPIRSVQPLQGTLSLAAAHYGRAAHASLPAWLAACRGAWGGRRS